MSGTGGPEPSLSLCSYKGHDTQNRKCKSQPQTATFLQGHTQALTFLEQQTPPRLHLPVGEGSQG